GEIAGIRQREVPVAVLSPNLAKLARPIGKNSGKAGVRQIGLRGSPAAVEASAHGPAAVEPVFRRRIHSKSVLRLEREKRGKLVPRAPKHFRAEQKILVNGAAQR